MRSRGFTLLELLLSTVILVVITAIVYAVFSSVMNSVSVTRVAAEELRLRQFLAKSIETNFSEVYADASYSQEVFRFIGVNDDATYGPKDKVRFCSSAPLIGGVSLPGDVKEVRYEVLDPESSKMELTWDNEEPKPETPMLEVTETPFVGGNVQGVDQTTATFVTDPGYVAPSWTVPISTLDLKYYDGTNWLEEWDSQQMGRMPWAVQVRINFAKTEHQLGAEKRMGYDALDDPDFEMIVPVRAGLGVRMDLRTQQQPPQGDNQNRPQDQQQQQKPEEEEGPHSGRYIPSEGQQPAPQLAGGKP